jgi:hypothetical protein
MKGRVDKSMGIVTLIAEGLVKINPTEPLLEDSPSMQLAESETDQIPEDKSAKLVKDRRS